MDSELLLRLEGKRQRIDDLRPLSAAVIEALERYWDVELTYTSNAIEGNTLTHQETALVIEKGITVGGKTLREHLEAQDHFAAVRYMRELVRAGRPLVESDIAELHRRIVMRSRPEIAGRYSDLPRRVSGSAVIFPNPAKIPRLMSELGSWLGAEIASPDTAFQAHLRLVTIHPFVDGNGRTARLLMNAILLKAGYPPVPIGPNHRADYLATLEQAQLSENAEPFSTFLGGCLDQTLDRYLEAIAQAQSPD